MGRQAPYCPGMLPGCNSQRITWNWRCRMVSLCKLGTTLFQVGTPGIDKKMVLRTRVDLLDTPFPWKSLRELAFFRHFSVASTEKRHPRNSGCRWTLVCAYWGQWQAPQEGESGSQGEMSWNETINDNRFPMVPYCSLPSFIAAAKACQAAKLSKHWRRPCCVPTLLCDWWVFECRSWNLGKLHGLVTAGWVWKQGASQHCTCAHRNSVDHWYLVAIFLDPHASFSQASHKLVFAHASRRLKIKQILR